MTHPPLDRLPLVMRMVGGGGGRVVVPSSSLRQQTVRMFVRAAAASLSSSSSSIVRFRNNNEIPAAKNRTCSYSTTSDTKQQYHNDGSGCKNSTSDFSTFLSPSRSTMATTTSRIDEARSWSCLPVMSGTTMMTRTFASSSAAAAMTDDDDVDTSGHTPFLLADIGEGIKEVELMQWFVAPGDTVQQFDNICEVQSDKATVEITSRFDGIVTKLNGDIGDMIQVGTPLLYLKVDHSHSHGHHHASADGGVGGGNRLQDDEDHPEPDDRLKIPTVASHYHLESDRDGDDDRNDHYQSNETTGKYQASPAVRKLGKEYNLDLRTIHPSGPNGRLLKIDVITYLKEQGKWKGGTNITDKISASVASEPSATSTTTTYVETAESSSTSTSPATKRTTDDTGEAEYEIVQLKGYHRLMAQTMTQALTIPHMGFGDELVLNELVQLRKELKAQQQAAAAATTTHEGDGNLNISVLSFIIKACSLALHEYPMMNAWVHDVDACQIRINHSHNIGIAVDTPRGLVVPVMHNVQTKSLIEIQMELNELKQKAHASKLTQHDLEGATFTLSNIGSVGVGTYMSPVIVSPQLGMGAFGMIQRVPRFISHDSQQVEEVYIMNVSWAGDHRFLDGATLARFHKSFKRYMEHPSHMLLQMK